MPKKKSKAKRSMPEVEQLDSRSTLRARLVRWAAISVILALMLSLLVAAITVSPSSAATPTPTVCAAADSDGDGQSNDIDSDIDGDGTVNGLDDDIDGDEILNGADSDPAATNCGANAPLPILYEEKAVQENTQPAWPIIIALVVAAAGYLLLQRLRSARK